MIKIHVFDRNIAFNLLYSIKQMFKMKYELSYNSWIHLGGIY